jgi:hypothetical protein
MHGFRKVYTRGQRIRPALRPDVRPESP